MNPAIKELNRIAPDNWVGCHNGDDPVRPKKEPWNPLRNTLASTKNPRTWGTLAQAMRAPDCYGEYGLVFTNTPIIGLDFDNVIDPPFSMVPPWLQQVVDDLATYTEYSRSGTGIHLYAQVVDKPALLERVDKYRGATINPDDGPLGNVNYRPIPQAGECPVIYDEKGKIKPPGFELKQHHMYFVVTGTPYPGTTTEINTLPHDEVMRIVALHKPTVKPQREKRTTSNITPAMVGALLPSSTSTPGTLDTTPPWVVTHYQLALSKAVEMVRGATSGNHHNTRYNAGRLMGGAMRRVNDWGYTIATDEHVGDLLLQASTITNPAETEKERKTILDAIREGWDKPIAIQYAFSDLGNAHRFIDVCGDRLRYIAESKMWLVWNGKIWERVTSDAPVKRIAHKVARSISEGLSTIDNDEERKGLRKWGGISEGAGRVDAMITSAIPYLTIPANQLDKQPHLLCVNNGIVNLKTGDLQPHNPEHYITKIVPVDYTPGLATPYWNAFLDTVFLGNRELIDYIQRAVGYTLTGSTDEHCLFFLYGVGKNGKSVFFEVLRMLTGEHHVVTSIDALLSTEQTGGATPYVADLQGARCAIASEMPQGKRFNESLIKTITGGDTLTARRLFGQPFSFQPTHTLWVSGNHRPRIMGTDEGIWRRLRVVPFDAVIKQPRPASDLLEEFTRELGGILAWGVEGSRAWYNEKHLPDSPTVTRATNEYRGEEDIVALFISECCHIGPKYLTLRKSVFDAFLAWGRNENEKSVDKITKRMLTQRLQTGWNIQRGGTGDMYYMGLGLIDGSRYDD
jgi:putative DNA primase/helicase